MTPPVQISVRDRVEGSQMLEVTSLLAEAFQFDPMYEWFFPNRSHQTRQLRRLFELDLRYRLNRNAHAHLAGHVGVAFWHAPGCSSSQRWSGVHIAPALASVLVRHPVSALRLRRSLLRTQPVEPHWYLSQLAVAGSSRGRGVGRSLIEAGTNHADEDAVGCYLETSNPTNLAYFRTVGFAQIGIVKVAGAPEVWRLWRAPR